MSLAQLMQNSVQSYQQNHNNNQQQQALNTSYPDLNSSSDFENDENAPYTYKENDNNFNTHENYEKQHRQPNNLSNNTQNQHSNFENQYNSQPLKNSNDNRYNMNHNHNDNHYGQPPTYTINDDRVNSNNNNPYGMPPSTPGSDYGNNQYDNNTYNNQNSNSHQSNNQMPNTPTTKKSNSKSSNSTYAIQKEYRKSKEMDNFFKTLKAHKITITQHFFLDEKMKKTRCHFCVKDGVDRSWSWQTSSDAKKGHLYKFHARELEDLLEEAQRKNIHRDNPSSVSKKMKMSNQHNSNHSNSNNKYDNNDPNNILLNENSLGCTPSSHSLSPDGTCSSSYVKSVFSNSTSSSKRFTERKSIQLLGSSENSLRPPVINNHKGAPAAPPRSKMHEGPGGKGIKLEQVKLESSTSEENNLGFGVVKMQF